MRRITTCGLGALLIGSLCMGLAWAENVGSLGYSEETVILPSQGSDCSDGTLIYNHDGSFENGYCWVYGGIDPPYYGAFGEAYDLGPVEVVCGSYWFTHVLEYPGWPMDCYIWEGGVSTEPGGVLCLVTDVVPENVPHWPECGQNDIELGCCTDSEFTVGYWIDLSHLPRRIFICADENGPPGHPWTCIAPGIGYPTGWQHPNVVFPECRSLGMGVYYGESPSSRECTSWGAIRTLFRQD